MSASAVATPASTGVDARTLAMNARNASRKLKSLGYQTRCVILSRIASALSSPENLPRILEANEIDVRAAQGGGMSPANFARLALTSSKLATLAAGLRQLSDSTFVADPVNKLVKETLIADGLTLQQRTVPLGVIMVIFESRPDGKDKRRRVTLIAARNWRERASHLLLGVFSFPLFQSSRS